MRAGREGGWYRTMSGTVDQMMLRDGKIVSQVRTPQGVVDVSADFVIDCTGLEADIAEHRLLADLLEHCGAGRNPLGRLDVERTFELRGSGSGTGLSMHQEPPPWAAISLVLTHSSACKSRPRRLPMTWRGGDSAHG